MARWLARIAPLAQPARAERTGLRRDSPLALAVYRQTPYLRWDIRARARCTTMGDGFQFLEIIVFALIAGFLVLRLRSVLGRRTGNERRRDPFVPPKPDTMSDKVVQLPARNGSAAAAATAAAA